MIIAVGLEELGVLSEVRLYPNPASGDAVLAFEGTESETAEVLLINTLGQTVQQISYEINNGLNTLKIQTNDLPNGMYTILLNTGRGSMNRRLIIQK